MNNAVFITYLEVARVQWYKDEVGDIHFRDFAFILARTEIDYLQPLYYTSNPYIEIWVEDIGNKSWTFAFKIYDKETEVIYARAKNVLVHYDFKLGKSLALTTRHLEILNKILRE